MAKNQVSEQPCPPADIGQLRELHQVSRAVFAGVCAENGWKPGRIVPEEEFLAAIKGFTGRPMHTTKTAGEGMK